LYRVEIFISGISVYVTQLEMSNEILY